MSRIEELANRYRSHIAAPWQHNLAGEQRMIFVVYPPVDERKLRARLELFEMATIESGHKWKSFDFTQTFARWMSNLEYKEIYFEEPDRALPACTGSQKYPRFSKKSPEIFAGGW